MVIAIGGDFVAFMTFALDICFLTQRPNFYASSRQSLAPQGVYAFESRYNSRGVRRVQSQCDGLGIDHSRLVAMVCDVTKRNNH